MGAPFLSRPPGLCATCAQRYPAPVVPFSLRQRRRLLPPLIHDTPDRRSARCGSAPAFAADGIVTNSALPRAYCDAPTQSSPDAPPPRCSSPSPPQGAAAHRGTRRCRVRERPGPARTAGRSPSSAEPGTTVRSTDPPGARQRVQFAPPARSGPRLRALAPCRICAGVPPPLHRATLHARGAFIASNPRPRGTGVAPRFMLVVFRFFICGILSSPGAHGDLAAFKPADVWESTVLKPRFMNGPAPAPAFRIPLLERPAGVTPPHRSRTHPSRLRVLSLRPLPRRCRSSPAVAPGGVAGFLGNRQHDFVRARSMSTTSDRNRRTSRSPSTPDDPSLSDSPRALRRRCRPHRVHPFPRVPVSHSWRHPRRGESAPKAVIIIPEASRTLVPFSGTWSGCSLRTPAGPRPAAARRAGTSRAARSTIIGSSGGPPRETSPMIAESRRWSVTSPSGVPCSSAHERDVLMALAEQVEQFPAPACSRARSGGVASCSSVTSSEISPAFTRSFTCTTPMSSSSPPLPGTREVQCVLVATATRIRATGSSGAASRCPSAAPCRLLAVWSLSPGTPVPRSSVRSRGTRPPARRWPGSFFLRLRRQLVHRRLLRVPGSSG